MSPMEMVNTEDFRRHSSYLVILHLDEDPYPNAIYSHEQMEYMAESAIRRRFVPALVDMLTDAITARICGIVIFRST
jgi:hypothetical protein